MMRTLMVIAALMSSTAVYAQEPSQPAASECLPSSHIDKVVVRLSDGTTRRGSLLCLGEAEGTLVEKQSIGRFRLDDVLSIRKAPDPVWDGAAKGASVALLMLVLCGGDCPAEAVLRTAAGYGLLGLALDAIDTNAEKIYGPARGRGTSLQVHVRF